MIADNKCWGLTSVQKIWAFTVLMFFWCVCSDKAYLTSLCYLRFSRRESILLWVFLIFCEVLLLFLKETKQTTTTQNKKETEPTFSKCLVLHFSLMRCSVFSYVGHPSTMSSEPHVQHNAKGRTCKHLLEPCFSQLAFFFI